MEKYKLFLIFFISLISCYYLTQYLLRTLTNLNILDEPDALRKSHKYPIPRGGGLSIVLTLLILGSLGEFFFTKSLALSTKFVPLLSLIALTSFLDDIKPSPILLRFFIYLITAALSIFIFLSPISLFHQLLPSYLDFILAVILFTAFINIFNFLDGMDGLTTSESIHLSLTILILCYLKSDTILHVNIVSMIATITLGCSISFLSFNWPPAKIFLGDVGSISLGFILGFCLLLIAASEVRLFVSCIIASLYYLSDGGFTIVIRLFNREKIWQPHLKHFFQKAAIKGHDTKYILKKIILCNFFLMILSISALYKPFESLILALIVLGVTLRYLIK